MEKVPKEISRYFNKHIIFPTYQFEFDLRIIYKVTFLSSFI